MHFLLKELVPPIANTLRYYSLKYGWKGSYKTYNEARKRSKGYDDDYILKQIIASTLKVKNGEIPYERDGIAYDTVQMNFPLLSTLQYIAAQNNNELTIIDFGGSLGTTYYQNYHYLSYLKKLNWCIVEQPMFVKAGREQFENKHVKFYDTIEECMLEHNPQIVLFCGVLQYIESAYDLLKAIALAGIPYLMLDFIGYTHKDEDRFTIQHVPPIFYGAEASYPCIFFNKAKLENQLKQYYDKVYDFISAHEKYYIQFRPFRYEGALFRLKDRL